MIMDELELLEVVETAKRASLLAGREICKAWWRSGNMTTTAHVSDDNAAFVSSEIDSDSFFVREKKSNDKDLVTETDIKCELIIKRVIERQFARFGKASVIVGEEECAKNEGTIPTFDEKIKFCWFVDPVDGTTNFVHRYPNSCVSVGVCFYGEPYVGCVFNPITREMFVGVKGRGSELIEMTVVNEEEDDDDENNTKGDDADADDLIYFREQGRTKINVSKCAKLSQALIATEIGVGRDEETIDAIMGRLRCLVQNSRSVRCTGSCAMNMCAVAAGRLDGYFEIGFGGPWDNCAATVIVREAGGVVIDPSGEEMHLNARRVLCANTQKVADEFVNVLKTVKDGPLEPAKPSIQFN
jgi:inositol-phosphate phosphatase / L-galactose 1-phosphate phosphatase